MNSTFRKLVTLTCLTAVGLIASPQNAKAFDFSLDPASDTANGEFKYDLQLDAGESITSGNGSTILPDFLSLTNFSGTVTANNPYTLDGSSTTSANLSVNTDTSGLTTLDDVIVIDAGSDFTIGAIDYNVSYSGGAIGDTVTGPVAVPFGTSTNSGILILSGIFGVNYLRRQKKAKNNADFS